jgi:hypothetical protein
MCRGYPVARISPHENLVTRLATNTYDWRLVSRRPAGDNDLAFGVEAYNIATLRVQRAEE